MAQVSDYSYLFSSTSWTAADLVSRFGAIPLNRIVRDPAPGTATVDDVVRLDDHHDRLCELIDGTLVEKAVGFWESQIAYRLGAILVQFIEQSNLGVVAGEAGMMQISPNQVRIPDISFISWEDLKDSGYPDKAAPNMPPTLAVEVISDSNTPQEMERKLGEYFEAGSKLVWYVYPKTKEVNVYTSPTQVAVLSETDTLTGGDLLPGLSIELKEIFKPLTGPSNPAQPPK